MDGVLAIQWQKRADGSAASRADRQPLNGNILAVFARHAVRVDDPDRRVPYRQTADFLGRG